MNGRNEYQCELRLIVKCRHSLTLLFLIIFIVLLFSACQTQERDIDENPTDIASPASDNPNEITMSVFLYIDTHLKDAALLYEEKTGIKVNVQNNYVKPNFDSPEYWSDLGGRSRKANVGQSRAAFEGTGVTLDYRNKLVY